LFLVVIYLSKYSAAEFVTKLNLKHNTFNALFLFDIRASTIIFNPLSLILLCPTYKNYKLGEFATIFSAMALVPSNDILLLNKFKYFKDVLFLSATASSDAPDTPKKFLLKSNTYKILLYGKTSASDLTPSFPREFLAKLSTLI
jgi:hypothetical protein